MEDKIIQSTANSIINANTDLLIDIGEITIDNLLDDSVIQQIPFIKTICSIAKTGLAIRDKHMVKKLLNFIIQLNSNTLDNENYNQYKEDLRNNDKKLYKELEYVLIIIDRFIQEKKTLILANLYYNYIDNKITWEEFEQLSIILDNIFIDDLVELQNIYMSRYITMNQIKNRASFNRLKVQNLVEDIPNLMRKSDGSIGFYYNKNDYRITDLGEKFMKYKDKQIQQN